MDVKPGETMYWMSDMGWMMGPWLVFGTLIIGASMVIYDGAPDFPEPDRTWQLVDQQQVTHLGLSPVLIRGPHACWGKARQQTQPQCPARRWFNGAVLGTLLLGIGYSSMCYRVVSPS